MYGNVLPFAAPKDLVSDDSALMTAWALHTVTQNEILSSSLSITIIGSINVFTDCGSIGLQIE